MKVKMTWYELVEREEILEVDSLEEAHNTEINLGNGEIVDITLITSNVKVNDIQHIVIDEENEDE
jgi:hypothetical protein|tara:strand:- start:584 stop:778 length:195 start_codon:yes stop_codon:yes gene_type:complete